MTNRPEGYPYTTVHHASGEYYAVLMDWSPHGFPQIADVGPRESDYVDAKRKAVDMAKLNDCSFKVPVHG